MSDGCEDGLWIKSRKETLDDGDFRYVLQNIPFGQTMSYGEIAKLTAHRKGMKTMSAQAVGGAVGHNPISLIIPCHRVIGTNGQLTGYDGGLDKKQWLLLNERVPTFKHL